MVATWSLAPISRAEITHVDRFGTPAVENLTLIHGPHLQSLPGEPVPGQRWTTVATRGKGTLTFSNHQASKSAPERRTEAGVYHLPLTPATIRPETLRFHADFPKLETSLLRATPLQGTVSLQRE